MQKVPILYTKESLYFGHKKKSGYEIWLDEMKASLFKVRDIINGHIGTIVQPIIEVISSVSNTVYMYIFFVLMSVYLFLMDLLLADAELVVAVALVIMLTLLYNKAINPIFTSFNKDIHSIYHVILSNTLMSRLGCVGIFRFNYRFMSMVKKFKFYFFNVYISDGTLNFKLDNYINPIKSLVRQELNLLLTYELKFLENLNTSRLFYSLYNTEQFLNCSYLYKLFKDTFVIMNVVFLASIYSKNISDILVGNLFSTKQFKQILLGFYLNTNCVNNLNYVK